MGSTAHGMTPPAAGARALAIGALALGLGAGTATAANAPAAAAAPAAKAASGDALEWVTAYDDALARARKEKKLVLLDFYTDWCGWCKRLDSDVFSKESFQKAAAGVLAVKVNAEKLPELARKYGVNSYPRLFFVNGDGMTVERIHGYLNLQDFTNKVTAVKRGDTEYARYRDAANDPRNVAAVQQFAQWLTDGGLHDQAIPYWQTLHDSSLEMIFQNPSQPAAMQMHRKALFQLGEGYRSAGIADVAVQQYDEVIRTYPDSQESLQAIMALGQLRAKNKAVKLPIATLEQVVRQQPGTPVAGQAEALLAQIKATGAGQ